MPFITYAERHGREEGERRGLLDLLGPFLKFKFGEEGEGFFAEVQQQDKLDTIRAVSHALTAGSGLDDLRKLLSPGNGQAPSAPGGGTLPSPDPSPPPSKGGSGGGRKKRGK
jgi:hypothetical protein